MRNTPLGGKGKGLVWLVQNIDELNGACEATVQVPEFENLDVTFYDDFLNNSFDRLESRCSELAEQFKGRSVAVRSSAVVSEDNEKHSGAGIYHTGFINRDNLTPDILADAVVEVYESVNSERAIQYRQEAGLNDEMMEVVIQEKANGFNGVTMSRLPSKRGIIPFWWSSTTGAVVSGDDKARIDTVYLTEDEIDANKLKPIFISDTGMNMLPRSRFMVDKFGPIVKKLRESYGMDFEAEFAVLFDYDTINLLQIRPLTNVSDQEFTFPDKKPILSANLVMGVGEYIGPWVMPEQVVDGWREPTHYAYMASKLDQMMPHAGEGSDYHKLTPNKKAIVLTSSSSPKLHALTLANERGLLCVCAGKIPKDYGSSARAQRPDLEVPLETLGEYIHVACDGLNGHVYRATKEEAEAFNKRLVFNTNYEITPLEESGSDQFWDLSFTVTPSDPNMREAISRDFVEYMQQVTGKQFEVRGSYCHPDLLLPGFECELYGAGFDPNDPKDGVWITTARSHQDLADKATTKKWFEGFIEKVQSPDYNPLV